MLCMKKTHNNIYRKFTSIEVELNEHNKIQ
jgi:hypothetical protein